MAESEASVKTNEVINHDLSHLLNGQPVPLNIVDFKRKEALHLVPKTNITVGYIVMTVMLREKQVLMVQEAKKECSGYWYLPAGHLEPNETLIQGAQRDVKEESGLDCEITTLLSVHFGSTSSIRFCFAGNVAGGSLKTKEHSDQGSLQAAFLDVNDVFNSKIVLRTSDILKSIQYAVLYRDSLLSVPLHPRLLPVSNIHTLMLHRALIVADLNKEGIFILACTSNNEPHLLSCAIAPSDNSLTIPLRLAVQEALTEDPQFDILGVLNVEHSGKTGHDGVCITTFVKLNVPEGQSLPIVRDTNYTWVPVLNKYMDKLHYRLEGHLVKLIEHH